MTDITDRLLLAAIRSYNPQKAILFGSKARGDFDESSDIDLVLIKDTSMPFLERLKKFAKLLPSHLPRVDAFIYTSHEFEEMRRGGNPLISMVLEEGKVIYETSS